MRLCLHALELVCLFVYKQDYAKKNYLTDFHKFGGKVARWPRKKQLYFDGKPDHATLGLELRSGYD